MTSFIVYRYDDEDFEDGKTVSARGDSFSSLTPDQKIVEAAIRARLPNGQKTRGASLYTWEDKDVAAKLWKLSKKKYLYMLEVDPEAVVLRGDLNNYSAAVDAVRAKTPFEEHVDRYCRGENAPLPWSPPRIEILVTSALVRASCERLKQGRARTP